MSTSRLPEDEFCWKSNELNSGWGLTFRQSVIDECVMVARQKCNYAHMKFKGDQSLIKATGETKFFIHRKM